MGAPLWALVVGDGYSHRFTHVGEHHDALGDEARAARCGTLGDGPLGETARLLLRAPREGDLDALVAL